MPRLLIPALLLLVGCSAPLSPGGPVQVRIANESSVSFDRVVVGFPEQEENYGAVPAGSQTDYRPIERAYRYAYIEVYVGAEKLVLQPVDHVGESFLREGRYTYVLDVGEQGKSLSFSLRRDP